ncbi:hypothetical protein [Atlantibacter sp.]|uniref:hypothetical protein n=1 Tax=Atlantibacter sp. TaxID=1903473 RepID=UPI0028AAA52B|nr:hypothetical protein [Atlantibacter sp.]
MDIASIDFKWDKELENPLFKTYRVICTIKTKEDVIVTGSTDGRIECTELSSDIFRSLRLERPEDIEDRAFRHANDMLYRATGKYAFELPGRRSRID